MAPGAMPAPAALRSAAAVLALAVLLGGCAATPRLSHVSGAPLAGRPRVALLTLENLTGSPDAGETLTRMLGAEIVARGLCDLVDIGEVQSVVRRLRVRNPAVLSPEQIRSLGDSLTAPFILTGSVLEHGTIATEDGTIPTCGAALKLIETSGGRVLWAKSLTMTGKDRETVFGFGREIDPARLDARLVDAMLEDLRRLTVAGSERGREGKP